MASMQSQGSAARQVPGIVLNLDPQQQNLDGHDDGQLIAFQLKPAQVHDDDSSLQGICSYIHRVPAQHFCL